MEGIIRAIPGITGTIARGAGDVPPYTGDYSVAPRVGEEVVLPTKNKRMKEDVTVGEIPIAEVSNAAGGKTLIISNEQRT
ncbi:MAG: hypothetical protein NC237_13445 [Eubacterium sp.]|nr:hypothetical protein [Eubacterium sp.]MCM1419702.1 hypothetical protein [Roseburia sp.]